VSKPGLPSVWSIPTACQGESETVCVPNRTKIRPPYPLPINYPPPWRNSSAVVGDIQRGCEIVGWGDLNAFSSLFLPLFPSSHHLPSFLPNSTISPNLLNQCLPTASLLSFFQPVADWFVLPLVLHWRIPDLVSSAYLYCPSASYRGQARDSSPCLQGLCTRLSSLCICCPCCALLAFYLGARQTAARPTISAALEAHQNKDDKKILHW